MKEPVLIVLVGLPGTGKSTFRAKLHEYTEMKFVEISSDDYIDTHAKSLDKTYNDVFKDVVGLANTHIETMARAAFLAKENVIWDQTNLNIGKRKKILDKFRGYVKIAVVFGIPEGWEERLLKRSVSEGKSIPSFIIEEMKKNFVYPSLDEGFNHITTSTRAFL